MLRFFDVPGDGRYQLFLHPGSDHATLVPGDPAKLVARLSELLARVSTPEPAGASATFG